jgi:allophanate hydrolase
MSGPLLTIDDWQSACRAGASPEGDLTARRDAIARRGAPVYLHVVEPRALRERVAALEALAATFADREALLAAHPLWGVPFVVKDNIDLEGAPTTAACPAFSYQPPRSATVVQRLLDAGAVCLAKCNLDQFATGLVGTRSPYGAPSSVWSAQHVSGGSSSGSAVAVALGEVPFSLGTDTAGSGRIPAAFNHIVGLKPTPGRVSTAGVLPACRTLDCPSIFALTVDDACQVLAVVEGPDDADPYSRFEPGPPARPGPLRIGVPSPMPPQVDADMAAAFAQGAGSLRRDGHRIVEVDFTPLFEVAELLYGGPWVAERHWVVRDLLARDPAALDPAVRQVVAQAERFSADDVFAAQYRLQALSRRAAQLWRDCDLLVVPTAPRHPRLAEVAADPLGTNSQLGLFTNFVNLLGWCALAVPAAMSGSGLPLGLTFIAPGGHDATLAAVGRRWQAVAAQALGATGRPWSAPAAPPARAPATSPVLPVAVVGAHLSGLPLNHQLTDLGATLMERTHTAPCYRLFALPATTPPKPGLLRVADGGRAIEVEVWALPLERVGAFLAGIASPLGLGSVALQDGRQVHGFVCEPVALQGAPDVSAHGGWRAYLASL